MMARNIDDLLKNLPPQRQKKIERRAAELATLKDLRLAMKRTQEDLAAALHIGQDSVSRLEKRSDMLLSTLRSYVEAMGGNLELVARFPDRPPVIIEQLADTSLSAKSVRQAAKE
jgi:transcriptional regulator with XRE-family HTH domain